MKYKFILTTLLSGYAFVAMAQANPVLVSDEITAGKFGKNLVFDSPITLAQYKYYGYGLDNVLIPFDHDNSALYVTKSQGVLHKLEIVYNYGMRATNVYGKNTPYEKAVNLYNSQDQGTPIAFSQETSPVSIDNFDEPYRYFGIAKGGDFLLQLIRVNVTWKLAYSRENVTPNNLGTICLPYDVEKEQLEGMTLYDVVGKTSTNEKEAIVCEEVDHIEAGKPYLFTSTSDALFLLYSNESSYTTEQKGTNGFYGNFTATTAGALRGDGEDDIYVVSSNAIKKAGEDVNIGANRAYIRRSELPVLTSEPASQSQRRYVLTEDGFAPYDDNCLTSGSLLRYSFSAPSSHAYDVHGRRVSATHRGIVVQEGRVVLH